MCLPLLAAPLLIGATTAGTTAGTIFAGMTVAQVGMMAGMTLMSGATAVFQQQTQKSMAKAQNKAATERFTRQQEVSNDNLRNKYEAISSRELVENRVAAQEQFVRDRQHEAALAESKVASASAGIKAASHSIQALEQAIGFNWEMSKTNVGYGLVTSSQQYQRMSEGYRSQSIGEQERAMPKYQQAPGLGGALLTTAGAGLGHATNIGGKDWLQGGFGAKKTPKASAPVVMADNITNYGPFGGTATA